MSAPTRDSDQAELLERQAHAIEVSGWGERFEFFQPRNLCLWVYLALVGTGAVQVVQTYAALIDYYAPALSAAFAIAVISTLAWGWWFHHLDHFERQPFALVVVCFLWGGLAATHAIAINGNTALGSLYTKWFGAVWSADWHAGLTAPFVEESAKAAGFVLVLGLAPRLVRTAADGVFLGAFLGLGFQTFEDFLYGASGATGGFGVDQVGNVTGSIVTRVFSDIVSHPLFSALVCAGLVYLIGTVAQPRRVALGLGLVASGVGLHLVWDSMLVLSLDSGVPTLAFLVIVMVIGLGLLWITFRTADHRERELAHEILAPEVAAGVLGRDDLDGLTGHRERRAYLKASRRGRERRRRKQVLAAALDLCHDLAASRGSDSPDVTESREVLRRLQEQRASVPA